MGSLSTPLFTNLPSVSLSTALARVPSIALWIWLNLLPFNINNQRQADGIAEDRINKPWRPIPSQRISAVAATQLMYRFYSIGLISSLYLGGAHQSISLLLLGYWYNCRGGADSSCLVRNLLNAAGYISFVTGAIDVAGRYGDTCLSGTGYTWLFLIAAMICSTVQIQDMADQEGDRIRGRRTLPLVLGDRGARWTIVAAVGFWSVVAPTFWAVSMRMYVAPVTLGMFVAGRVITRCSVDDDKKPSKYGICGL